MAQTTRDIAMIGFGEAGRAIALGRGGAIAARLAIFDIKLEGSDAPTIRAACETAGARCASDRAEALAQATHVFCLVTANEAVAATRQCAAFLRPGAFWFDGNS